MSVKISELPSASSVTSSDVVPIVQGGTTKQANLGIVASAGGVPTNSIMQYDGNTIPAGYEEVNGFDNYSTTEQRIGTWIDGKPLYEKTFNITTVANPSSTQNVIAITNADNIVNVSGFTIQADTSIVYMPYYYSSTAYTQIYRNTQGEIKILVGTSYGFGNTYVTIRFTKTTDSAS